MGHEHSVLETDTRFKINPITRQIVNESNKKLTLIQGDHNSERFGFEIPRHIEKHYYHPNIAGMKQIKIS